MSGRRCRNDERVHNGLLMIAIGRHIELTCPRRSSGAPSPPAAFLLGLANHAMSLGYSRAEVTEYVEDDAEQGAHDRHRPAVFSPSAA